MPRMFVFLLGTICSAMACFASPQDAAPAPAVSAPNPTEPEFSQQFFTLGPDALLVALERTRMQHQMKHHNYFVAVKVQSVQVIQGAQSAVRIVPDVHFIVRMQTGDRDPTTLIHLVRLTEQKDERELIQSGTSGYIFAGRKNQSAPAEVVLTAKKYGAHSLEIIPSQPLAPGEYAFLTAPERADCFGVDPK